LIVVGTSLFVYPAAGLATCVPATADCYLINPEIPTHFDVDGFTCIKEKAGVALPRLVRQL
jgi:NAD-dependent SIR2 family protein deacetylase